MFTRSPFRQQIHALFLLQCSFIYVSNFIHQFAHIREIEVRFNLDLFVSTVRENKGMGLLPDSEERLQHAVSDTHHDTPPTLDADCGSLDPPAATLKDFFGLYLMLR